MALPKALKSDVSLDRINYLLTNWSIFTKYLTHPRMLEDDVRMALDYERKGRNRAMFIERLEGRLTRMRREAAK